MNYNNEYTDEYATAAPKQVDALAEVTSYCSPVSAYNLSIWHNNDEGDRELVKEQVVLRADAGDALDALHLVRQSPTVHNSVACVGLDKAC